MNKTLTEIAVKMASEYSGHCHDSIAYAVDKAYLAGFEARDGMDDRLREEYAEMLDALRDTYHMLKNIKGYAYTATHICNLITKIESK